MTLDTDRKILKQLDEWSRGEGGLPHPLLFYRAVLDIQIAASSQIGETLPHLSEEVRKRRLKAGRPLASFTTLPVTWAQAKVVSQQVIAKVIEYYPEREVDARGVKRYLSKTTQMKKAARPWYENRELAPLLADGDVHEGLLAFLLLATLQPFLKAIAEAWKPDIDQELWRRGYCPLCGGIPDFSFLEKEVGGRWLLCSRCDTQWQFPRLACPFCNTRNQRSISYLTDEGGVYRLYRCDECHTYLKTVDLRKRQSDIVIPLERILTVDMDRQAQEKGYAAGWAIYPSP